MPISEKIYSQEAKKIVIEGTTLKAGQLTVTQIPPVAISWTSTKIFPTGSWSQVRPRFQRQLAPCRDGCPVNEDIEDVLHHVQHEDLEGAWHIILRENPIPAICGRICFHPCETACNRSYYDQQVGIHHVEREVGDYGIKKRLEIPVEREMQSIFRVAVVGSGPAGLATSYHLRLLGYQVSLFESQPLLGGLLRWGIPDFRLPPSILDAEIQRILSLGIKTYTGVSVGSDRMLNDLLSEFNAVFLAPGATQSYRLEIPGEDTDGVWSGLKFLNRINQGDHPDLGNNVAVIGGGNTAIDSARAARRLGADVTIIYRRSREEMPAFEDEIEEAISEGIAIEYLAAPVEILHTDGRVSGIRCVRMKLGEPDRSGRRRPIPIKGSEDEYPATAVLNAIGEGIDASRVDKNMSSLISGDKLGRTEIPNLFLGGDFEGGDRTVAHALGSGKRAAMLIDRFLSGEHSPKLPEEWMVGENGGWSAATAYLNDESPVAAPYLKWAELNPAYFDPITRRRERMQITERPDNFNEVRRGIGPTNAVREAERCFHCGHCNHCGNCFVFCPDTAITVEGHRKLVYDYDHCKGCGVCVEECPRHVIVLDPIR